MSETRQGRHDHLQRLFDRQNGRCFICGELAVLDFNGGRVGKRGSAVRFRLGSSYGAKGRVRKRVMAHRGCADDRSRQITMSIAPEEAHYRSGRYPSFEYEATTK
jgi:hypothetical protein